MTELERMDQAQTFINRYFEFEDAVNVSLENKEYLKTYIKDVNKVEADFDMKQHTKRSIILCIVGAIAAFLIFLIPFHKYILVPIVAAVFVLAPGFWFVFSVNRYRLSAAREHQKEVNEGIKEQIEILDLRITQLEKQRDDYFTALQKKIDFMELEIDYMKNIDKIKAKLEDGSAQTCEEAVEVFEQSMLMAQMTSIMSKSEFKPEMDMEKNKERFGDPLKVIEENKKKRKREKRKKK